MQRPQLEVVKQGLIRVFYIADDGLFYLIFPDEGVDTQPTKKLAQASIRRWANQHLDHAALQVGVATVEWNDLPEGETV